jgi:hypothetical protein
MRRGLILAISAALLAGCTPVHFWDAHTISASGSTSFDAVVRAPGRVATLGVLTPAGLQGFSPSLSHALASALVEESPSVRGMPSLETVNALNEHGLATEYAELISGFASTGILERQRLQKIEAALGAPHVLLSGLAEFREMLVDRFDLYGRKLFQSRMHHTSLDAALKHRDGPDALGIERRGQRGERAAPTGPYRSLRGHGAEALGAHDPIRKR